ncbi:hypothetical protein HII31_05192 [Pseudocercospora fuligena]|uniref:Uncharacterized protein n=1 Tax=Pseudocercospora fuligena TaxID=685502 RepID=A0A8H6VIB3_9PEZI|nr:hypothetical protein HII31_05192 [Pseudocercospora fuligena]
MNSKWLITGRLERADHLRPHNMILPVYIEDDACYTALPRAYEKQNNPCLGARSSAVIPMRQRYSSSQELPRGADGFAGRRTTSYRHGKIVPAAQQNTPVKCTITMKRFTSTCCCLNDVDQRPPRLAFNIRAIIAQ